MVALYRSNQSRPSLPLSSLPLSSLPLSSQSNSFSIARGQIESVNSTAAAAMMRFSLSDVRYFHQGRRLVCCAAYLSIYLPPQDVEFSPGWVRLFFRCSALQCKGEQGTRFGKERRHPVCPSVRPSPHLGDLSLSLLLCMRRRRRGEGGGVLRDSDPDSIISEGGKRERENGCWKVSDDASARFPDVQRGTAGFNTGKGKKLSHCQAVCLGGCAWLLLSVSPFPVSNPADQPCRLAIVSVGAICLTN